jgi:chemotaxis protein methyltransferase CheR
MNHTVPVENLHPVPHPVALTDREFRLFSKFIEGLCGIKMPGSKKHMIESRLQKRLRGLGLRSFSDYYDLVAGPNGARDELVKMIDAVTTNKTDFFREPAHFTYLTEKVLPALLISGKHGRIRIWSAGCSSGEEPYTLAMVLSEYNRRNQPCDFSILATDICTSVLEKGYKGVYEEERVAPIPQGLRKEYLLRSRDRSLGVVRVAPEIRSLVTFRRLNFLDENFGITEPMHIIFCRNVLIYFDRQTQEKLINRFRDQLIPGGHLFLGHSETINGMNVSLKQVNSTIYRKPA